MATGGGGGVMWGLGIKYNVQFMLVLAFENMRGAPNVGHTAEVYLESFPGKNKNKTDRKHQCWQIPMREYLMLFIGTCS
jgi:hypothetical protein